MSTTRRSLLRGSLALAAGALLPSSLFKKKATLTDADRVLTQVISRRLDDTDAHPLYVSRIRVHPLFYERMSLAQINGVGVEPVGGAANERGYVVYYRIAFDSCTTPEVSTCGCFNRPEIMDKWIRKQLT
jgi:hypothetical protein